MARYFHALSLKARIIVSATALSVAGICGLTIHFAAVLQDDVQQLLSDQLTAMVSYVAADLDAKLKLRIDLLQEIADAATPDALLQPGRMQQLLDSHRLPSAMFPSGAGIASNTGKTLARFGAQAPGDAAAFAAYMADPRRRDARCKPFVVQPDDESHVQPRVREDAIAVVVPICTRQGRVAGMVFGTIPLSDRDLFGQLVQTQGVTGSYLLVISRETRRVLFANDRKRNLERINDRHPVNIDRRFAGTAVGPDAHGIEVLSVGRSLKQADWFVLGAVPTELVFAPVATLRLRAGVAALLITLAMSCILFWRLKRLLAPLDAAADAMLAMTSGSVPLATLPVERDDEVGRLIRSFNRLVVERNAAHAKIEHGALHDPLTGFPNRQLVRQRFEHACEQAARQAGKAALLFVDVDHFKAVNDSLGYAAGDEILKIVGARLRRCVRDADTVGRVGGDEYLIVLREIGHAGDVIRIVDKILQRMSQPFTLAGRQLFISSSIGAAICPDDGSDFNTVYKKADTAMYHAKEAGRNTFRFFQPSMDMDTIECLELRSELKRALEGGELELHYQPQIDLAAGRVIGAEALVRWNHPKRGLMMPDHFIHTAEDSGLIAALGTWVLREACRQAAAWKQAGLRELVVAVNFSAVQFKRDDLEQTVVAALNDCGLAPEQLALELTESILIKDAEKALHTVRRLKNRGIKLLIDDFGTGYASLAYLKRFALDKIKIDRSFISNLSGDPEDAAIVGAIVQIARCLRLKTIAEGVEDERTLNCLRQLQCDEAQGFYFAQPMPPEEFVQYLLRSGVRPTPIGYAAGRAHAGMAANADWPA